MDTRSGRSTFTSNEVLHFNHLLIPSITMKALFLSASAMLFAGVANAQEPVQEATHVLRYQQCPWKDVVVVPAGDSAAANNNTVGFFTLPKTNTRKTFADLSEKDLKQVKKAAHRSHTCLVAVDDDYHTPKQIKDPDLKREAELNGKVLFYFMAPCTTIDKGCDLPPYHKRDREQWQAASAAE